MEPQRCVPCQVLAPEGWTLLSQVLLTPELLVPLVSVWSLLHCSSGSWPVRSPRQHPRLCQPVSAQAWFPFLSAIVPSLYLLGLLCLAFSLPPSHPLTASLEDFGEEAEIGGWVLAACFTGSPIWLSALLTSHKIAPQ